jgi:hypothetical protein
MSARNRPVVSSTEMARPAGTSVPDRVFLCDRCGTKMIERQCKIICPNCGSCIDCSDLTIHFDKLQGTA